MQEENGGAGVYSMDMRKLYMLQNPDWKQDIIPEILNGHNIADFVDAEIEEKLKELDFEEDELAEEWLRQVGALSCLARRGVGLRLGQGRQENYWRLCVCLDLCCRG